MNTRAQNRSCKLVLFLGLLLAAVAPVWSASLDAPAAPVSAGRAQPFILGADISWVPQDEAQGAQYYDHGVRKDIFTILKEYKFNYIRLRLFVNPAAPDGYAAGQPQAFCDLAHTEAMAKRIKAAGMGFLLDLHYSDIWASPGHQKKPAAWADLSFPQLTQMVHDYTRSVIAALKAQGTPPEMVQIGNETSDGMLFPDGSARNFDHFATLVKAGIAGAKEADPSVKIVLHNHLGRDDLEVRTWVDNFLARGVKFDIVGLSCYAQAHPGDWQTTFNDLATRYPHLSFIVAEYSAHKRSLNDLVYNAPNGKGLGTFIWEPIRYREAIFDKDGRNAGLPPLQTPGAAVAPKRFDHGGRYDTNALIDLYPVMSQDYGNDALASAKTAGHGKKHTP